MDVKDYAKQLGSKGGSATRDKYGNEYFKKLSELAMKARKEKKANSL